jgi:paraquat-inducible protein B
VNDEELQAIRDLRAAVESQERTITEGFTSLRASAESQARSIESLRENVSYNTETMATALELAAISQRTAAASQETAAAAMELSANTSRNLDRLAQDITEMKQMIGILINEGRADRTRITRLEGQN